MEHIGLHVYNKEDNNVIIGKTIKGVSFNNGYYENDPQLIITFTDDTYIFLKATIDDNDPWFENRKATPLQNYSYPPGNVVVDENGNKSFKYTYNIEEQIRLGLVKPDREKELIKIKEYEECTNKRDYERYLELKEKYESLVTNKVKFYVKALANERYNLYIGDKIGNLLFIGTHVDFNLLGLDTKNFTDMKEGQVREVHLNLED